MPSGSAAVSLVPMTAPSPVLFFPCPWACLRALPHCSPAGQARQAPPRPLSFLFAELLLVSQGIFISRVSEEGPAARAGVRVGDKLLEVSQ